MNNNHIIMSPAKVDSSAYCMINISDIIDTTRHDYLHADQTATAACSLFSENTSFFLSFEGQNCVFCTNHLP